MVVPIVADALREGDVVLVTGGSGLLGHGVQDAVKDFIDGKHATFGVDWSKVKFVWLTSKDADLKDKDAVRVLFERHRPAAVIHLAARVGGLFANMADNVGFFRDNMAINDCVTSLCHEFGVRKAIFCLSTCVLPCDAPIPLQECSFHDGPPHFSNEGYAYSKRMLEVLVRLYRDTYGYDWRCVIPTNLFGCHDSYNLQDSHVVPGMLHRMYLAKKAGEDFTIYGSGNPRRQFLYNVDAGRFILWILEAQPEAKDFSLVTLCPFVDDEISIREMAEKVAKNLDYKGKICCDVSKADGIFRKPASNSVLDKFLGDRLQFSDFDKCLSISCKWFEDNFESCRK